MSPDESRRARLLRRRFPLGAYYNVERAAGGILSTHFDDAGDPYVGPAHRIVGGPFPDQATAIARGRPDRLYRHLLKSALESGLLRASSGHSKVTVALLADWTGFSRDAIYGWLKPVTSDSHRKIPRYAIRLILHEFMMRDQSITPWVRMLNQCR